MILSLLLGLVQPIETLPLARLPQPGWAATVRRIAPRPPQIPCTAAPSPLETDLFVLGHYDTQAISDVWLKSPERETHVADVVVQPGRPIHLVISGSQRTIYRIRGATRRVRRLTLMNTTAAGATGIPASRVEHSGGCIAYQPMSNGQPVPMSTAAEAFYNRRPTAAEAVYELGIVRIDRDFSFAGYPAPDSPSADPESRELLNFSRGGVRSVPASRVTSNVAHGRYEVLPQAAGVRQLVKSGALVRATRADSDAWRQRAGEAGTSYGLAPYGTSYGAYRVVRPIRIPAGLCGAHSISLYVSSRDWVSGDVCHSTLYLDDGTRAGS